MLMMFWSTRLTTELTRVMYMVSEVNTILTSSTSKQRKFEYRVNTTSLEQPSTAKTW